MEGRPETGSSLPSPVNGGGTGTGALEVSECVGSSQNGIHCEQSPGLQCPQAGQMK